MFMPSLHDIIGFMARVASEAGHSFSEDLAGELEKQIRRAYPGERIYIAPSTSRKDPARGQQIAELARRLTTGVVAERMGVSRSYVHRIVKK
ncbi:MAG TPA: hypothetical protein PLU79_00545 [Burkholderiaceae bacterium]|nr:hypothetical protein [Burkholderiaceae bacterium]